MNLTIQQTLPSHLQRLDLVNHQMNCDLTAVFVCNTGTADVRQFDQKSRQGISKCFSCADDARFRSGRLQIGSRLEKLFSSTRQPKWRQVTTHATCWLNKPPDALPVAVINELLLSWHLFAYCILFVIDWLCKYDFINVSPRRSSLLSIYM